ncbi:epoxide hydrolase family protein [Cellulosimicrobium sp. Marseille-Q4280]|uniref:epoxide hydrolase family protein n=1 Tax=Cellulosimicrobium sp. Marseille-Q4280 TaxID=2937992 RepID=UPI00203E9A85|nr:epoxide hydrolase family protein [Cellulosimicrobium sp. Marseille-Q4280]
MEFRPFTIDVPQAALDDLRDRLLRTRWPSEPETDGWQRGTELSTMRRLAAHWTDGYDWRAHEARLNRFHHVATTIDGHEVHAIHERAVRPGAAAVLLLHGWADSFYRYAHVVDRLTGRDPGVGPDEPVFDVVVPSLPGFDFSEQPEAGTVSGTQTADVVARLMTGLGYERYLAHGGDWGSVVAQEVARAHPDRVIGLHLTDVPFPNLFLVDRETASEAERTMFAALETWSETHGGYVGIQSSRPLTLSYGLSDSPVGLAAWLVDHFAYLSDTLPSDDDLLTNVMLYWVGNSIRSSMRLYNEGLDGDWGDGASDDAWEGAGDDGAEDDSASSQGGWGEGGDDAGWSVRVDVPTALAIFPRDILPPPREYAERFFDVRRFTTMPRGGHFAALEEPQLVVDDLRAFAAELDGAAQLDRTTGPDRAAEPTG